MRSLSRWCFRLSLPAFVALGCTGEVTESGPLESDEDGEEILYNSNILTEAFWRGRDLWFNEDFNGWKFFKWLRDGRHPQLGEILPPEKRINIAFHKVIQTPRAQRFAVWGVINDPDCTANLAGGPDLCPDPEASGVIGIRKHVQPDGSIEYGATCAACHAGFNPLFPPLDPAEPSWLNIHATIGNQYLDFAKVFGANLNPQTNPTDALKYMVFSTWPKGAVDTTALFDDGIVNPGVVTAFWEHKNRPKFEVHMNGVSLGPKMRNGQGGEDDVGGDLAALRVYTNIGVCYFECVFPAQMTNQPVSRQMCEETCADWPTQQQLDDISTFLAGHKAPRYPRLFVDRARYARGAELFAENCASCHSSNAVLSNDEITLLVRDWRPNFLTGDLHQTSNTTNTCRALGTNWDAGRIWADFGSDEFKARAAAGLKGYRTMPLTGIWATAPFMHNQSIGTWAPANASLTQRRANYENSMRELLNPARAANPVFRGFSLQPETFGTPFLLTPQGKLPIKVALSQGRCMDGVENRGHYYGTQLSDSAKEDLIYWLLFQ